MQFSIVDIASVQGAIYSSKFGSVNHYLREFNIPPKKKNTNKLCPEWQNITETIAFADERKSILAIQIQEALWRIN